MQEPYRIILLEDEPALSELLTRLIRKYHPTAAIQAYDNGQDALAAYDRTGADLLLLDHGVPGIDGVTLTRMLRERGASAPIVGMSGNTLYYEEYIAAGANEFVGGSNLYDQLKRLLERLFPPPQADTGKP